MAPNEPQVWDFYEDELEGVIDGVSIRNEVTAINGPGLVGNAAMKVRLAAPDIRFAYESLASEEFNLSVDPLRNKDRLAVGADSTKVLELCSREAPIRGGDRGESDCVVVAHTLDASDQICSREKPTYD